MKRENKVRGGKIRFFLILVIAGVCSSCIKKTPTWHFTPSVDLSNVKAVNMVQEKMPFKIALIIPQSTRKRDSIIGQYRYTEPIYKTNRWSGKKKLERYETRIGAKSYPVRLNDSTIELFKDGLEVLFDEVEIIDEVETNIENINKYSLVFKVVIDKASGEKNLYDAWRYTEISYNVTVYSPRDTYNRTFVVSGKGAYAPGGIRIGLNLLYLPIGFGTLGLSSYVYNPSEDGATLSYSYAFAQAQEKAFDNFINQLIYQNTRFEAFRRSETVRLAAKCNLSSSPLFADQHAIIPNNLLDAVETGEIIVSLSNNGEGTGFDVQLKITSQNAYTSIVEHYNVGEIPPNETKKVSIPISANLDIEDGWEELYIETKEKRGYDAPPVKLKIQTAKLERPELSIVSVEINDGNRGLAKGNGNGIPENEETVELIAFIKNSGEGPGRKVNLTLEEINSRVEVVRKSQEIGTVNVGEIVKGKVVIRIPRTFDEKILEYRLKVTDARKGASEDEREFALNLGLLRPVLAYGHKVKDSGVAGVSGNGNGHVENGEKIALIITPRNNGTTVGENVTILINPPPGISADRQRVSVGSLAQGKDGLPVEFLLSIPRTYDSTSLSIPLKISQSDFEGIEDRIDIPVRIVKPRLELAGFRLNGIKGQTTVGKNQEAELEIFIKNSGELAANGLTVTLTQNVKGVVLKEENRTLRYGTLQPGMETDSLRFPIFIQQSAEAGSLPIQITISQNTFPQTTEPLQLAIQEGVIQEVVVKGEKLKRSRSFISSATNFPPEIIIDSPFDGDRTTEPEITLRFRVSDDKEIRKIDIQLNGIKYARGIDIQPKSKSDRRQLRDRKNIALVEGTNTIRIIAYDNQNERTEKKVTVHYSKELGLGRTFAIIIGIADYEHSGIRDLDYTENDARALKDFLMSNEGGRVPEENIKFMVGSEATAANIRNAVGDWLPVAANRRNDRVLLFFAGHGVKKRSRGYFLAYNTNPDKIVGTSVKMQDITDYLYDVEAKTVIFLSDACHSGAAFEQRLAKRGDSMDGGFLINQFSGEGHITMVAAKAGQESIELPEYEHGLFTYYLLKGLKGEADKKGNGDKKVDIHELYRYVYDQVTEDAKKQNFSQNPKMDIQVEGDIIMAIVP